MAMSIDRTNRHQHGFDSQPTVVISTIVKQSQLLAWFQLEETASITNIWYTFMNLLVCHTKRLCREKR
jgi:hypothetical protein